MYIILYMVEIRKVRVSGGSASLTLPKCTNLQVGDYVEISLVGAQTCLKKVNVNDS